MRMQRLAGWWRLWIVLTVIYGGLVSYFTWGTWPKADSPHEPSFIEEMSPEALAVVKRPKNLIEFENAITKADRAGDTENARKLAQELRHYRELPLWKHDPIIFQMPNGYTFEVARDTTREQIELLVNDYDRVVQAAASEKRSAELRGAFLWWLVPSILICILGLAVAWVIRGFTGGRVQG